MRPQLSMFMFLAAVTACGSSSHSNPDATKNPDAKVFMDAPPNVPAMITISGTGTDQGLTSKPYDGAVVAVYKRSDPSTPLGMATTDAQGKYSIQIATGGMVVDGYIKSTKANHADGYGFPAIPWQADDPNADPQGLGTGLYSILSGMLGSSAGKGLIVINLVDASGHAVAGATITTTPGSDKYSYNGDNGQPDGSKVMTNTDGIGFAGGVPPGKVTISATKAGVVFKSHEIDVHADAFTTATITE